MAELRELWSGLTPRGRGFVLVGLVACAESWLVGRPSFLPVGALLVSLPLLALVLARRSRFRLAAARSATPKRVALGGPVTVTLALTNLARIATGLLLLSDEVPRPFGTSRRFIVSAIPSQAERVVSYELTPLARGRRDIGPLRIRVVDAFGMVRLDRSFSSVDQIVVHPRIETLSGADRSGRWAGGGDVATRTLVAAGADDIVPRDYRTGDELRRVHWPATAKYGELMVRREERPWRTHATVLLDNRSNAHVGTDQESSFEWLVSAAASVAAELMRRGFVVDLVDHAGRTLERDLERGAGGLTRLLDRLADVGLDPTSRRWPDERAPEGIAVALLGRLDTQDAERIGGWRSPNTASFALVLDPTAWEHPDAAGGAEPAGVAALRRAGWRAQAFRGGMSVAAAWTGLISSSAVRPGRGVA